MAKTKELNHIAIIMDGNGRWAEKRGLKRIEGHKEGTRAVKRTLNAAKKYGIKYITLYAFSTENWNRPKDEVMGLMSLLKNFLSENIEEIKSQGLRLKTIGRIEKLPFPTRIKLLKSIEETKNNTEGTVVLALNYGGRSEIVDAVKKIAEKVKEGALKISAVNEDSFSEYLYDSEIPDPDLMIRTSGEFRISNFLLWQLSYSEMYITDILWPDFGEEEFKKAIDSYYNRDRRFGRSK